jgi:hypothetical protein
MPSGWLTFAARQPSAWTARTRISLSPRGVSCTISCLGGGIPVTGCRPARCAGGATTAESERARWARVDGREWPARLAARPGASRWACRYRSAVQPRARWDRSARGIVVSWVAWAGSGRVAWYRPLISPAGPVSGLVPPSPPASGLTTRDRPRNIHINRPPGSCGSGRPGADRDSADRQTRRTWRRYHHEAAARRWPMLARDWGDRVCVGSWA